MRFRRYQSYDQRSRSPEEEEEFFAEEEMTGESESSPEEFSAADLPVEDGELQLDSEPETPGGDESSEPEAPGWDAAWDEPIEVSETVTGDLEISDEFEEVEEESAAMIVSEDEQESEELQFDFEDQYQLQ